METKRFNEPDSFISVGSRPRLTATDYGSITADNQQDILLRRRRKAIAVFEKDMLAKIESGQQLQTKRFLNNLRRSELLLKEHESTKRTLFARHSQNLKEESPRIVEARKNHEKLSSSLSGRGVSEVETTNAPEYEEFDKNRAFSGKLKRINDKIDVPYVKLNTYTREDLRRPSTSLELKRKAWEKVSQHLEENRSLRPSSAGFVAKCEGSVPRNVREAREKLRALTKVRLLSELPAAPPRIDVDKVLKTRSETERIEKQVVREFCQSLGHLKVALPPTFCWMDVNEVYLRSAEVHQQNPGETVGHDLNVWQEKTGCPEKVDLKDDWGLKRRRRKGKMQVQTI